MRLQTLRIWLLLLFSQTSSLSTVLPIPNCAWKGTLDPKCEAAGFDGLYPRCSMYQYTDRSPIPCRGLEGEDHCDTSVVRVPPTAASWHVHVFFPNIHCTNCSSFFMRESANFSYHQAMQLRAEMASFLNRAAARARGSALSDPIDVGRALRDPGYSQCIDVYHIVAGAPANYHDAPCIYEVDMHKELGPFTNPATGLGYPNYSFFIPSDIWTPGLLKGLISWLQALRSAGHYNKYDVLIHPNTGCESRDHVDPKSPDITWFGTKHPLQPAIFSCSALGCNQACPSNAPPPANCSRPVKHTGVRRRR